MKEMSNDPIRVFSPKFRTDEILVQIKECLDLGWTGMGYKTNEFEKEWNKYTGLNNSYFLSSNTVGLHLALRILGIFKKWKDGDEIITTPLTFVSTNHSILYENLKPVFADVDEYLCLDPASIEERITDKTRGVFFVGMGGNPGKLNQVAELCKKYDLSLILDAAHMAGTYVDSDKKDNLHVGHEADISVFSFQAVKNLPTADSGMICFKNKEHYNLCKKLAWLGIDADTYSRSQSDGSYKWHYDVPHVGFKYHGNSIMAAMALTQIKYLDSDNKRRNEISRLYTEKLKDFKHIKIIHDSTYCKSSSKHLYQILISKKDIEHKGKDLRDKIIAYFHENKIYPGVHYIDNTKYPMYNYDNGKCPNSHDYSERLITLPIHLNLSNKDIEKVINTLKESFKVDL